MSPHRPPFAVCLIVASALVVAGCKNTTAMDSVVAATDQRQSPPETVTVTVPGADVTPVPALPPVAGSDPLPVVADLTDPSAYVGDPRLYPPTTATRFIYFGYNADAIPAVAYAALKAHARYLAAHPQASLRLSGHTDERGTSGYNLALGEKRGIAVRRFLELNGARPAQLEVVSFGEEKPAELGQDELSWARNRRVEIDYVAGEPAAS